MTITLWQKELAGKLERDNNLIYNTIIIYNLNERLNGHLRLFVSVYVSIVEYETFIDNSTVLLSTTN